MRVHLLFSFLIFAASLAVSIGVLRKHGRMNPFHVLFGGTFIAIVLLILPAAGVRSVNAVLTALHTVMRVFLADGGLEVLPPLVSPLYYGWAAVLFILAPVLTFGFVLSFFKDLMALLRLGLVGCFRKKWYIFSELNEQAVAFAKSVPADQKVLLIFTSTKDADESDISDAADLGAVLLNRTEFHRLKLKRGAEAFFFAIGRNSQRNLAAAVNVIERHGLRGKTWLYAFAPEEAAELVLDSALESAHVITVRRIDPELSLVHQTLYEESIFENAIAENGIRRIAAVVLGLGNIGAQLTKALCWCGQMDGYQVDIQAFDKSAGAVERLAVECPSLLEHSGKGGADEDRYTLTLHGGVDFMSIAFGELVKPASLVFIAMGADQYNIAAALEVRAIFERMGCMPRIYAFVYDSAQAGLLHRQELRNYKGQDYGIKIIGDFAEQYSYRNILHSEIDQDALAVHLHSGSGPAEYFYRYDYCYRSSVAGAIHAKWVKTLGLSPSPMVEHCRWSAYMRSIGYRYAPVRSDRAKTHPAIVPYRKLPLAEQEKDRNIVKKDIY